jgi:hypothetical protein
MPIPRDEWMKRRAAARRTFISPSISSCELVSRSDGSFDVKIRGQDFYLVVAIPHVEIGGRPVRRVTMHGHDRIEGIVEHGEPGDQVTVILDPDSPLTATVEKVT